MHKSDDLKKATVQFYKNNNVSLSLTCRIFGCSRRSLRRWIDNGIVRNKRKPVSYKVTQQYVDSAIRHLEKHKTISMPELHQLLLVEYPQIDISVRHLSRVIRENNYTRKRTRHGHFPKSRWNKPVSKDTKLDKFYKVVKSQPLNKIISIDETSLSPFMYRRYSRCKLGDKCVQETDNNKVFTKHTFVGAITTKGVLEWELYQDGAMNTRRFNNFVSKIIANHQLKGYLFVMDNAGAHRNKMIKATIENSGNQIVYTVPYQPQTNVIENWFSQFKHYMRTATVRTFDEIAIDAQVVIDNIDAKSYENMFRYAYEKKYANKPKKKSTRFLKPKNYKK